MSEMTRFTVCSFNTFKASTPFTAVSTRYSEESCFTTNACISRLSSTTKRVYRCCSKAVPAPLSSEDSPPVTGSLCSIATVCSCFSGSDSRKQLFSIESSMHNVPSWSSANERASASPIPVPGTERKAPVLYWMNGLKISSRISTGMTRPSLHTESSSLSPSEYSLMHI